MELPDFVLKNKTLLKSVIANEKITFTEKETLIFGCLLDDKGKEELTKLLRKTYNLE